MHNKAGRGFRKPDLALGSFNLSKHSYKLIGILLPTISKNFLVLTNIELDIFRTDQPCPLEGVGGRNTQGVNL